MRYTRKAISCIHIKELALHLFSLTLASHKQEAFFYTLHSVNLCNTNRKENCGLMSASLHTGAKLPTTTGPSKHHVSLVATFKANKREYINKTTLELL